MACSRAAHMFREFFCCCRPRAASQGHAICVVLVAWCGLVLIVAYATFAAYTKMLLNEWYKDFYDLLGDVPTDARPEEVGSGFDGAVDGTALPESDNAFFGHMDRAAYARERAWTERRERVGHELTAFAWIVAPLVVVTPVAKWVRSVWAFEWRSALMRSYLADWSAAGDESAIEGSAQRLHEDTQRFSSALQGCLSLVLDAVLMLAVFTPILIDLGGAVAPPPWLRWLRSDVFGSAWLFALALTAAVVGLGGAVVLGRYLVTLEVRNQVVEAELRRDLVLLESGIAPSQTLARSSSAPNAMALGSFAAVLTALRQNYHALFRHFAALNTFLSAFDQVMVLAPYLLVAPMIFAVDPADRVTLGVLIQVANSFDKVFASLSLLSENYAAINDFRSVVRRLAEFERDLVARRALASTRGPSARPPARPPVYSSPASRPEDETASETSETALAPTGAESDRLTRSARRRAYGFARQLRLHARGTAQPVWTERRGADAAAACARNAEMAVVVVDGQPVHARSPDGPSAGGAGGAGAGRRSPLRARYDPELDVTVL